MEERETDSDRFIEFGQNKIVTNSNQALRKRYPELSSKPFVNLGIRINLAARKSIREQTLAQEVSWLRELVNSLKKENLRLRQQVRSLKNAYVCDRSQIGRTHHQKKLLKVEENELDNFEVFGEMPCEALQTLIKEEPVENTAVISEPENEDLLDPDYLFFTSTNELEEPDDNSRSDPDFEDTPLKSLRPNKSTNRYKKVIIRTSSQALPKSNIISRPPPADRPDKDSLAKIKESLGKIERDKITGKYKCPVCTKQLKHSRDLIQHFYAHKPELKSFKCKRCGKAFSRDSYLLRHQTVCNQKATTSTTVLNENVLKMLEDINSNSELLELLNELKVRDKRTHKLICPVCENQYKENRELVRHFYNHKPELKPYSCDSCGKTFASSTCLLKHTGRSRCIALAAQQKQIAGTGTGITVQQQNEGNCKTDLISQMSQAVKISKEERRLKLKRNNNIQKPGKKSSAVTAAKIVRKKILKQSNRLPSGKVLCTKCGTMLNGNRTSNNIHIERCTGEIKETAKPRLNCTECELKFVKTYSLTTHLRKQHGHANDRFVCNICLSQFICQEDLDNHKEFHQTQTPEEIESYKKFLCSVCNKKFISLGAVKLHMKAHMNKPFFCNNCKRKFYIEEDLKNHLKKSSCGKVSDTNQGNKVEHLLDYETGSTNTGQTSNSAGSNMLPGSSDGFNNDTELFVASKTESTNMKGTNPFPSFRIAQPANTHSSDTSSYLLNPTTGRTRSKFSCKNCSEVLNSYSALQLHVLHYHKDSIDENMFFKCPDCNRHFESQDKLDSHIRNVHQEDKPFACNICSAKFTANCSLQRHIRVQHTEKNLKPYACPYCSRKFADIYKLKSHQNKHEGNLPFLCDMCPGKFSTLSVMMCHKRNCHLNAKPEKFVIDADGVGRLVVQQTNEPS